MILTDTVVNLGRLSLRFGQVERITFHEDGVTPEADTTHTVMLGLIAAAVARQYTLLDVGLVAQYALVHDLVEAYAGDMPTLRILSDDRKAEKKVREHAAYTRIAFEFGLDLPWVNETIATYERREVPEARFVRAMDKLMPKITHILNEAVTVKAEGMNADDLTARLDLQRAELWTYAADFPIIFQLFDELAVRVLDMLRVGVAS